MNKKPSISSAFLYLYLLINDLPINKKTTHKVPFYPFIYLASKKSLITESQVAQLQKLALRMEGLLHQHHVRHKPNLVEYTVSILSQLA